MPPFLRSEPRAGEGLGPSPGALALTMLTWGPQEKPKRGRTPELCEEVVSTYIQNCQLFVYSEVVSTYIQNCQLFVYSEVVSTYIQNCQLFVYMGASAARSRGGPEPPPCLLLCICATLVKFHLLIHEIKCTHQDPGSVPEHRTTIFIFKTIQTYIHLRNLKFFMFVILKSRRKQGHSITWTHGQRVG